MTVDSIVCTGASFIINIMQTILSEDLDKESFSLLRTCHL